MRNILATLLCLLALSPAVGQRLLPFAYGTDGYWVNRLVQHNGQLIIGGQFNSIAGFPRRSLVAWNGGNSYDSLGTAFGCHNCYVQDMITFGSDLIAVGKDNTQLVARRYESGEWFPMGTPFSSTPLCLAEYNGQLYVGGQMTFGSLPQGRYVLRYDGSAWVSFGIGFNHFVRTLCVHDGSLYAGGSFTMDATGSTWLGCIARWNGTEWVALANGLDGQVTDLMSTPQGLMIVGDFAGESGGSTPLHGGTVWDGTSFNPIGVQLDGTNKRCFRSQEFGVGVSSTAGTWLRSPTGNWDLLDPREIRDVVEFNGTTIVGGRWNHYWSYETTAIIGRWLAGTDMQWMDAGGMRVMCGPFNDQFFDLRHGRAGLASHTDPMLHSLFSERLFMVGRSSSGDLHMTPNFYSTQSSYTPKAGPWCLDTTVSFKDRYFQTWQVDRAMIDQHMNNWWSPGYVIPYALEDWPGNGDLANGEPAALLPFQDLNANGIYEPHAGEHPLIRGDRSTRTILSDQRIGSPLFLRMGVDLYVDAFGYDVPIGDTLHHTVFQSYTVINRSSQTYDTLWIGNFVDTDIGNANDDFMGCDTLLAMSFGYNADANDETTSSGNGYGAYPPAMGVSCLNAGLHAWRIVHNDGTVNGDPQTPMDHYYYLNGRNRAGVLPVLCGPLAPDSIPTRYMFPSHPGDTGGCSDATSGNQPADRRGIASYGPFLNFAPGDTICLDLAFIFAQDSSGDNLSSVTLLKQRAQAVRHWYQQQPLSCGQYPVLGMAQQPAAPFSFHLYPNPASNTVTVECDLRGEAQLTVYSATGQLHRSQRWAAHTNRLELPLTGLAPGLYIVDLRSDDGAVRKRLVVQ